MIDLQNVLKEGVNKQREGRKTPLKLIDGGPSIRDARVGQRDLRKYLPTTAN